MNDPIGIWSIAYVQRNAEDTMPICDALISKSRMISGAAIERLTRSM